MPEPELETALRRAISEACRQDVSGLDLDTDLVMALGLDSLGGLRLLAALEKRFEMRFPDQRLGELRTLRQLLEAMGRPPRDIP